MRSRVYTTYVARGVPEGATVWWRCPGGHETYGQEVPTCWCLQPMDALLMRWVVR